MTLSHRSRLVVPLAAMIATSATSALNATTGATKSSPIVKFDAGDAEIITPHGAKKAPAAKKQIVIGDQPKTGTATFKPATKEARAINLASQMPAYVESKFAAAKKAPNAQVHHRATNKTGGLGVNRYHGEAIGVMDLVAAAAMKPYGPATTVLRS